MEEFFNIDIALEYAGGCVNIFLGLQKRFISEYKGYSRTIKRKLKKGNNEEVHRLVHSLKGISMNLGAPRLFEESLKAEEILESKINDPLDDYIHVFEKTYNAIKRYEH